MQSQEIERKFLVSVLPKDLERYSHDDITQGYLAIGTDGTEVRLRKRGNRYFETIKGSGDKIRSETEIEITQDQFNALRGATQGKRVEKTRYEIPHSDMVIELDIYGMKLEGLLSAEVEFPNEEQSNVFIPPEWFGKEITDDKRYKNRNLALYGLPER